MNDELKNLDLSSLSFDQFTQFFFARKVVPDKEQFDLFMVDLSGETYDESVAMSPSVVVDHLTALFSNFGQIASRYTIEQIDQGFWGIFGANLELYDLIFDSAVPLHNRLACIRAMYYVFSDFVAHLQTELTADLSAFYMWWDLILHGFWNPNRPFIPNTYRGDASRLDQESRQMLDVVFETLQQILALPDRESQKSALHGLGHLHHPGVHDVVQQFIDTRRSDFRMDWLQQCRDCACA